MKKTLFLYGAWSLFWLLLAILGKIYPAYRELAISAHFILSFTGLPLGLLSLHVSNGTVLGVALAGAIGTGQWVLVAELNHRWERWQASREKKSLT